MAKHIWSVLCRRSVIDKDDGSLSLFDVMEGLERFVPSIPASPGTLALGIFMHLVTYWERDNAATPESATARLRVEDPSGKELANQEMPIDLAAGIRSRYILRFGGGAPYTIDGTYRYIVQRKAGTRWLTVANLPFEMTSPPNASAKN